MSGVIFLSTLTHSQTKKKQKQHLIFLCRWVALLLLLLCSNCVSLTLYSTSGLTRGWSDLPILASSLSERYDHHDGDSAVMSDSLHEACHLWRPGRRMTDGERLFHLFIYLYCPVINHITQNENLNVGVTAVAPRTSTPLHLQCTNNCGGEKNKKKIRLLVCPWQLYFGWHPQFNKMYNPV